MNTLLKVTAWFLVCAMLLVGYTNIPKLIQNYTDLVVIKNAVLRSAKYEGGFHQRSLNLLNKRIEESSLEPSNLTVTLSPGKNVEVNKRERLEIQLVYDFNFDILTLSGRKEELRPIRIKDYGYSQKYFK